MSQKRVSSFATQITRLGLVNAYLVRELDGFTLVDTAIPGTANTIQSVAQRTHTGPIRRVLLTHAHGDHIGSLDALASQIGGAVGTPVDVAISQRDARLLPKKPKQDRSLDPGEPRCKIKGSLPGANTPPSHLVTDGELYGSLRAIATPGHTPGHFCFLDERDGTLYAGDALVTVGGSPHVTGFGPWYFPFPRIATWHRPTAVESIRKLINLSDTVPIERIAPGHGQVLEGGRDLLETALKHAI